MFLEIRRYNESDFYFSVTCKPFFASDVKLDRKKIYVVDNCSLLSLFRITYHHSVINNHSTLKTKRLVLILQSYELFILGRDISTKLSLCEGAQTLESLTSSEDCQNISMNHVKLGDD